MDFITLSTDQVRDFLAGIESQITERIDQRLQILVDAAKHNIEYVDRERAAAILAVEPRTLDKYERAGHFTSSKPAGFKRYYAIKDLNQFMAGKSNDCIAASTSSKPKSFR